MLPSVKSAQLFTVTVVPSVSLHSALPAPALAHADKPLSLGSVVADCEIQAVYVPPRPAAFARA